MMGLVSLRGGGWEAKLADWRSSGLSGSRWCRENGVAYHRFLYWRRQFESSFGDGGFVEVEVSDRHADRSGIGLECGGVRIAVERGFDAELLAEVVQVLRRV